MKNEIRKENLSKIIPEFYFIYYQLIRLKLHCIPYKTVAMRPHGRPFI